MPWESERNLRSLSPHGLKEAQGHAAPALCWLWSNAARPFVDDAARRYKIEPVYAAAAGCG
jgi:hypothetical protein